MMNYTKEEKLAVVKMVDYVILADSKVAPAEMQFLTQLMDRFTFDSFFIGQARNLNKDLASEIFSISFSCTKPSDNATSSKSWARAFFLGRDIVLKIL